MNASKQTPARLIIESMPEVAKIQVKGWLDERIETSDLAKEVQGMIGSHQHVTLDFGELDRANSSGLRYLALLLQKHQSQVSVDFLPVFFVELINFAAIIPLKTEIKHILIPFYNPNSDELVEVSALVGKDIPILEQYENFDCTHLLPEGSPLVPDFDPEDLLGFLSDRL